MDSFGNSALPSAKMTMLQPTSSSPINCVSTPIPSSEDIPAPPAYHMVVDANMPIPNVASPYDDGEGEEEEDKEDENDTPEVTINAATQIRGHGNIISIAQMDSVRIANLITSMLDCGNHNKEPADTAGQPITPPSPPTMGTAQAEQTSRTQVRGVKRYPNINITVNCGATIIGDRNIVGPGLGDIARHMQMTQRNQAAAALHSQQQQQQAAAVQGQKMPSPPIQRSNTLYQAQAGNVTSHYTVPAPLSSSSYGVTTPPMSRSSSLHSDGDSKKRKSRHAGEEYAAKRHC